MSTQANMAQPVNGPQVAVPTAVDRVWRIYYTLLNNGTANDIKITPAHAVLIGEKGVQIIMNRYSNLIQAPVKFHIDGATGIYCIQPSRSPLGQRPLPGEKVVLPTKSSSTLQGRNWRGKLPRPPNSFILYRQRHHPLVTKKYPNLHNNEISLILGRQWREESEEVKNEFKAMAEELKKKHIRDHPDYQYQPRKPSEKKRRMTRRKAAALAVQGPEATAVSQTGLILEHSDLPHLETTANGNVVVNLGDNDLDDNALAAMLEAYNVCRPTTATLNNSQIAFRGVAALHSEPSQDAQEEFNFYSEIANDQNDFADDFAEDQMQIEQYAENYEETFDHLLARYTTIYDQQ